MITKSEWAYFEKTFSKFKYLFQWLGLIKNDPEKVSACWNLKRDYECNNCSRKVFEMFLHDLDLEFMHMFSKQSVSEILSQPPRYIYKRVCKDKYCIISNDFREIDSSKHDICDGIGQCKFDPDLDGIPYEDERLCRVLQEDKFVFQYALSSGLSNEDAYNMVEDIRDGSIKAYTFLKCNNINRDAFWVTTLSDYDQIKENIHSDLATEVRNALALDHFKSKNMIVIKYPATGFLIRKIAKPVSTSSPTVPFRVECSENRWGMTARLDTAENCSREAVICPHDLEPSIFDFSIIGIPSQTPLDYFLHNDKIKY
jgi:hypothetical protein